jgi:hypothetical protein
MNKKNGSKLPVLELNNLKAVMNDADKKLELIKELLKNFDSLEEAKEHYEARRIELAKEYTERLTSK